ncbi:hypothetical protein O0I10_006776 [Lichtheimia ornata]|uniref:SH3 domain-containing protein n=1 Tax=Lichtheimia ornata TaxID=688661 RepID=A0AAD7V1B4_9FUNG|nr:uncharacterized protein O0I10_006776 [Lichtheimia ornata]KAJ8657474.1 hypothetical protein O0I10_006776 [Lichtheimia ornata]
MQKIKSAASNISINSPIPTSLAGECKKAAKILNSFVDPGQGLDKVIPPGILEKAQGLAIFTVLKAGFLFSGRAGGGLVVARLDDNSWSAPSAIATGGVGAGGQIGAELTDFVLVLNTKQAVKTFSQFGNVTLGGNVSVAAGPIGRNAEAAGSASLKQVSAVYSYSKTRGFFAGVSLEGSVIVTRGDANEKLYGQKVAAKDLLEGKIPPPPEADALYRALNARFHNLGNTGAMYAAGRASIDNGGSPTRSQTFKSTNISAPGSLRQPPITRNAAPPPPSYTSTPSNQYGSQYSTPSSYGTPTASVQRPPPPPPPPSRKPRQETARALYDFTGEQAGDLSFREGDIITIVEKSNSQDDWWTGSIGARKGMFPANYVQMQ